MARFAWRYNLRDFLFGNTFYGISCLAIHLTRFVGLASLQARLRGCQTNLAKCIAIQHQREWMSNRPLARVISGRMTLLAKSGDTLT
ncbi:hypothetical protein Y032_0001g294 [Ancylostoma ceylanicum]|uniref:Uncharacterized protein n=1 Tax=Ancylostoma ceylanicum TaxID=53326 RepID=A0A016W2W2_9BILA|nr:hypothetical protein Y032_0001g294 [Ancylostoma ceylanicum]